MKRLEPLLKFAELLNQYRLVKRVIRVNGEDRWENDVEHSYQMAMLAWYIVDSCDLSLDVNKVLRYALVHDLVEVYAGDTYLYSDDQTLHDSKQSREAEAQKQLEATFSEFGDLHTAIEQYERHEDRESRFIYALDKIQPLFNMYLDKGRTWNEKGITFEMLMESKKGKADVSPEMKSYFDELFQLLKDNKEKLFHK